MKNKGGRPPFPTHLQKSKSIRVPLTQAEHAAITELARRTGESASAIMLDLVLRKAKRAGIEIKDPTEK